MSRRCHQSDESGALIGFLFVAAALWLLRWVILTALAITVAVAGVRWFLRWQAQHRAAELARVDAIRKRAEIQNAQILRGDPAGFFGQYPVPDPELIPAWYTIGGEVICW